MQVVKRDDFIITATAAAPVATRYTQQPCSPPPLGLGLLRADDNNCDKPSILSCKLLRYNPLMSIRHRLADKFGPRLSNVRGDKEKHA